VTYPNQPPRPGPPPGGFRPSSPPGRPGGHPGPLSGGQPPGPGPRPDPAPQAYAEHGGAARTTSQYREGATGGTGHPAVDAVLQSLANAATLAPADQIAEYEAAYQVLQETLAGIDR